MLRLVLFLAVIGLFATPQWTEGAPAKIKKVLWFYLDAEGRQSLSPSLFERDAYQALLRSDPAKRSGLRFDVQWTASTSASLVLRVQARGALGTTNTTKVIDLPVRKRGLFSRWAEVKIIGDDYRNFGELVAWRATLRQGDVEIAEQRSFLWQERSASR